LRNGYSCTSDLTAGQQEGSKKQVLHCPIKTIFTESKKNGVDTMKRYIMRQSKL